MAEQTQRGMALGPSPFGTRMGQKTTATTAELCAAPTELCDTPTAATTEPLSADSNEERTTGTAAVTAAITV